MAKRSVILNRYLEYVVNAVEVAKAHKVISPKPCEICGVENGVHGHHTSYLPDDILRLTWLCPKHHKAAHKETSPIYPDDSTAYDFIDSKVTQQEDGMWKIEREWRDKQKSEDKNILFTFFKNVACYSATQKELHITRPRINKALGRMGLWPSR